MGQQTVGMNHQHGLQHPQSPQAHNQLMAQQQQQQWIRQQQMQMMRQQQTLGNNGAQAPQTQQFLAYSQGNQMGANQIGAGNPQLAQLSGNMNPGVGNQMGSTGGPTLQPQIPSQISMGQIGNPGVNQIGAPLGNPTLQSQLQQQRFAGRPTPVPTPVSGPSPSPRTMPTPSPRPHHPPTPSHSPHPVASGSAASQLDILHSPQLIPDDSVLTAQEQLTKYVEQL